MCTLLFPHVTLVSVLITCTSVPQSRSHIGNPGPVYLDESIFFTAGSEFTTGFPTLAEVIGNASLLSEELFVTHDGERRTYNHMGFSCDGVVTKLTYIALHGSGTDHIVFEIRRSHLRSYTTSSSASKFGAYGYQLASHMSFYAGDRFLVDANQQAPSSRLLYRIGEQSHTVCWSWMDDNWRCDLDKDYPLLAVETGNCYVEHTVEGLRTIVV